MFAKMKTILLSAVVAIASVCPGQASVIKGEPGTLFYRYKIGDLSSAVLPEPEAKDVTAFYVGGVGFRFSEVLPLKPEWEDDTWRVLPGSALPAGITFNSGTRSFDGTPTDPAMGLKVELEGVDSLGEVVATAEVTFDIYSIQGRSIKVDLYAHTGKYKADELSIPTGVTVDSWQRIYMPPEGVTVNGRFFEGTPSSAGQWPVMIIGRNYMGETVVTFWGKYTVEDGPVFNHAFDFSDIRPLPFKAPYPRFQFGAPGGFYVLRSIDPTKSVKYILERDPTLGLPQGVSVTRADPKNLRLDGRVTIPYETGKVRFKAIDSDGTTGYSGWYTFGTGDPMLACQRNIVTWLPTGRSVNISVPRPVGTRGTPVFTLASGSLPSGLRLVDGKIVGTPSTAGETVSVTINTEFVVDGNTSTTECPIRFAITAGSLTLKDATPPQDSLVRVESTYNGTLKVTGGQTSYRVDFKDQTSVPGFAFTTDNVDTDMVGVSGVVSASGSRELAFSIANGDGNSVDGFLNLTGFDPLRVDTVPTISIQRLAASKTWGSIPVDMDTVIPDASGAKDYPEVVMSNPAGLPLGTKLEGLGIVGSTDAAVGSYGTQTATVTDYENKPVTSNAFEVVVLPRDEIASETPVAPTFNVEWDVDQTKTPVTFKQPPGAEAFTVEYELVNLSGRPLPDWLAFNVDTGELTAKAGIPRADLGTYGPYAVKATDQEGSTDISDQFSIAVADWPTPTANVTASWRGTVAGDTSAGETATWLNIPGTTAATLADFVNPDSVIGGRSSVTFTGSDPSTPAGLGTVSADGTFAGRPTREFKGDVKVTFKDTKGREGTMSLPLEVRAYPTVQMTQDEYELPRLSRAETLETPIHGKVVQGFWSAPVWSLDTTRGPLLPKTSLDTDPLRVDPETGMIDGFTKAASGTRADGLVLKATSKGANGETLESWTKPFSVVISDPIPMTLSYDRADLTYYLAEDGLGGYTASNSTVSRTTTVRGSFVDPLSFTMDSVQAVSDGMTGTLNVNASNGNIIGYPDRLGQWNVFVNAKDGEGREAESPFSFTVKATLDGFINPAIDRDEFTLRQDERFTTDPLQVSNAVGSVVYATQPAILRSGLTFDAMTGAFAEGSYFDSPMMDYRIHISATDADGRGFATNPEYRFTVKAPLAANFTAPLSVFEAKQYTGRIDIQLPVNVENAIGTITYAIEGDLPGQLVNRLYDADGNFTGWYWRDEDGADRSVPASTPANQVADLLPPDALVFDTRTPSLNGIPSKTGTFGDIRIVALDSHAEEYEDPTSPNRMAYNRAETDSISIQVLPADAFVLNNSAETETLHQYTTVPRLSTLAVNAAYGRAVTWTAVSGDLPLGVSPLEGATKLAYAGYPTKTGTFGDIVWRAKDAAGRIAASNAVSFTVEDRLPVELVASMNPIGVVKGKAVGNVTVTARNTAYGLPVADSDWTLPLTSSLPDGITAEADSGSVHLLGSSEAVGEYTLAFAARDSLGAAGSLSVPMAVLSEDEAIDVSSPSARTKKNVPTEIQLSLDSRTFGKVSYASQDRAVVVSATGTATAVYNALGTKNPVVTVSDETGRSTDHALSIQVIDQLEVSYPDVVYAEEGKSPAVGVKVKNVLGTVTYEKGKGSWPAGLEVDPSTGEIRGAPSGKGEYKGLTVIGTDTFTVAGVTLTDRQESKPFDVNVDGAPTGFVLTSSIAPETVAAMVVNRVAPDLVVSPVNQGWGLPIPASKWTISGQENLPPGIKASAEENGVRFSGTPTLIGTFPGIQVTATDALNQTAFYDVTFKVLTPEDEIGLTVADIRTKTNVAFSMQPTATNTYGAVRFYSYAIDGDPQTNVRGDLAQELDIDRDNGLVTGSFETVGDREFDVFVTDATKRVTSKPVTVSVIPNVRVTVPTQVTAEQGIALNGKVATDYVLGTVAYAKGSGSWPTEFDVNPSTGAVVATYKDPATGVVSNSVTAAVGTYPGLTVRATDTFTVDGVTYTDTQESNAFAIVVTPIDAAPVITNPSKTILGTQNTAITNWQPTVMDNVKGRPWNYAGTTYALNQDLSQYGLEFDTNTGVISGTPHTPFIIRNMVITVTSPRGDSDSSAPFWIGVAPEAPLEAVASQNAHYTYRLSTPVLTDPIVLKDTPPGTVTFVNRTGGLSFNATTGVFSYTGTKPASWVKTWSYDVGISDEFNRSGAFQFDITYLNSLSLTPSTIEVFSKNVDYNDILAPTLSGKYGTVTYSATGLPPGMAVNPNTGALSGKVPDTEAVGKVYNVTITASDDYALAPATASASYSLTLADTTAGYRFWKVEFDVGSSGHSEITEIELYDAQSANVAMTKSPKLTSSPAQFDTTAKWGQLAGVVNGDRSTNTSYFGVRPFSGSRAFIAFEFTQPQSLGQVRVYNHIDTQYRSKNHVVYASNDGVTWDRKYAGPSSTVYLASYVLQ